MNKIVEVKHLYINYQTPADEIAAVADISFDIYENEFVSIVGPSGCGKSTLLSCIAGLIAPSSAASLSTAGRPRLTAPSDTCSSATRCLNGETR